MSSFSQEEREMQKRPPRTDKFIRMKGIRMGYDLTRPVQYLWNIGDRYGSEVSFDMEVVPNTFPVFETGWEAQKINSDFLQYRSSGSYSRVGVDYNFLVAEHKNDKDILFMGLRYGFTLARQQVESFTSTSYWEQSVGRFPPQNFNAHWAEIVLGTRIEVLKNVFLGWSIRGKIGLSHKDFDMPPVYFIPGYGKAENGFNFDFSYAVLYNLPVDLLKVFRKAE
ncbi:MAG: DUF6048 family protein [Prolixibacteraceae bacterium]|jgi:hypothetical protein|nr:DUF6048 family protein [Prolixibacteraceae bacterium]